MRGLNILGAAAVAATVWAAAPAAEAAPIHFVGSVTNVASFTDPGGFAGLGIKTENLRTLDFTLDVGQTTFAPMFDIYTTESSIDLDDALLAKNISVSVAFNAPPPPFGDSADGTTRGRILFQDGIVTWDNSNVHPFTFSFGDGGILQMVLREATFGTGPGERAIVEASFKLVQAPRQVPEPLTLSLLGAGLLGVGVVTRMRKAA